MDISENKTTNSTIFVQKKLFKKIMLYEPFQSLLILFWSDKFQLLIEYKPEERRVFQPRLLFRPTTKTTS